MTPPHLEQMESAMRGKQIVWTAAIALAVVVGYQAYAAKKA